jgi:putative membrane protein
MMREPAWRREGSEPDYRFSLANERTFLAWVRTALAVLAGGVLLQQFSTRLEPQIAVLDVASLLCILAAVMCLQAYSRWRANEIAMRHGQKLPPTGALLTLAAGTFTTALVLAALVVLATYRGA